MKTITINSYQCQYMRRWEGVSFFVIQDLLYANALYRVPPPDEKYIYSSDYFTGQYFVFIFSLFYRYFFICSFAISLTTLLSVPYSVENFYRLMIIHI